MNGPSFRRREPFINVLECKCDDIQIRKDWNGHVGGNELFMEVMKCIAGVASLRTLSQSPHPIFDFVKHLCDHFIHKETNGRTITAGHFGSMSDDVKVVYSMRDGARAEQALLGTIDVFAQSRVDKRLGVYLPTYDENGKLRIAAGLAGTLMHEYWHYLRLQNEEVAAWCQGSISDAEND